MSDFYVFPIRAGQCLILDCPDSADGVSGSCFICNTIRLVSLLSAVCDISLKMGVMAVLPDSVIAMIFGHMAYFLSCEFNSPRCKSS